MSTPAGEFNRAHHEIVHVAAILPRRRRRRLSISSVECNFWRCSLGRVAQASTSCSAAFIADGARRTTNENPTRATRDSPATLILVIESNLARQVFDRIVMNQGEPHPVDLEWFATAR